MLNGMPLEILLPKHVANKEWPHLSCNQCDKEAKALIRVGEPIEYYSATAHLCIGCVAEAHRALQAVVNEKNVLPEITCEELRQELKQLLISEKTSLDSYGSNAYISDKEFEKDNAKALSMLTEEQRKEVFETPPKK